MSEERVLYDTASTSDLEADPCRVGYQRWLENTHLLGSKYDSLSIFQVWVIAWHARDEEIEGAKQEIWREAREEALAAVLAQSARLQVTGSIVEWAVQQARERLEE